MFELKTDWKEVLKKELEENYYKSLNSFLKEEYNTQNVFPKKEDVFNALNKTAYKDVKVVIIGQDPYHGKGQAHGLAFSVKNGKIPPSLRNIYKELSSDCECYIPKSADLTSWAKQGVLLINSVLTVREKTPNSHKGKGWENFTKAIVKSLNDKQEKVVFLLWGNHAIAYEKFIDKTKHTVLKTTHPSPFSANNGFLGCKHFSKTNRILKENNKKPINWQIEDCQQDFFS